MNTMNDSLIINEKETFCNMQFVLSFFFFFRYISNLALFCTALSVEPYVGYITEKRVCGCVWGREV